ncbi:hypothetical protein B7P43_G16079 [Cryptotermes secundus]|uniref:Uncharacterized protein n=1 Tax=Cryptotermes secundus TaxID=105785 RepID=A0A2J7RB64_9NEOP|nr:hypothetical protein B7P43_G16079 [Cryptotermes secundus]
MDQDLRRSVKTIFHDLQCTANGLLHCGKKNGGLGIPKLETIYTMTALKMGLKFQLNSDPVMKAVFEETGLKQKLEDITRATRINLRITRIGQIEAHKNRLQEREIKEWAQLTSQGKAVAAFIRDKIGNAWLANPTIFRSSRLITALKMRANVAGDRVALSRAKITKDIEYRKCRAQKETLGHILGQCTYMKKERIEKHDSIKDFVMEKVAVHDKEAAITRDPTPSSPEGGSQN